MPQRSIGRIVFFLFLLLAFLVDGTTACPVCYGDKSSSVTEGLNWAIVVLLGVTGTVLSAFGALFLRIRRRSKITLNGTVDFPSQN